MTTLLLSFALGLQHGTDPDHLTAIDGLSRMRSRATNGLYFAIGHGFFVTVLAVGVGQIVAKRAGFLGPWLLILIGVVNLVKLVRTSTAPDGPRRNDRPVIAQPFLLGVLLAAGFETTSQLSALLLAGETNPWVLGAAFTTGMIVVDGFDGYLAASTLRLAATGARNAQKASRLLGFVVVVTSLGLGGMELLGFELNHLALPLGLALFAVVIGIRIWARSGPGELVKEAALVPSQSLPVLP